MLCKTVQTLAVIGHTSLSCLIEQTCAFKLQLVAQGTYEVMQLSDLKTIESIV